MSGNTVSSLSKTVGQVKWFNNKAGYGFITIKEEDGTSKDIFAHYTNLKVDDSQYKYLVQGEYVEFVLAPLEDGKHEVQAKEITGINGGQLMCETRKLNTPLVPPSSSSRSGPSRRGPRAPRTERAPRPSDNQEVTAVSDEDGFTKVTKKSRRSA